MGGEIVIWQLIVQIASVIGGAAGPWLIYQHRARQAAFQRLVDKLDHVDTAFKLHEQEDRKNFKRVNKALKRIVKQFFMPDAAASRPEAKSGAD